MKRGLGWLPDPPPSTDERLEHVARVGALPGVTAAEGGIAAAPWILDQLGESCTGHWSVQTIFGLTDFRASPYVSWWLARATDAPDGAVTDVGVSTFAMIRAIERHGAAPWDGWNPTSPGFTVLRPPPALSRLSAQRHRLDVTPIWDGGSAAVEACCAALEAGLPCGLVVEVDGGFDHATFGVIGPESGASRGRHMTTLWRFRTNVAGRREFLLVNQWGLSWGDRGTAWVAEERVSAAPFLCFSRMAP